MRVLYWTEGFWPRIGGVPRIASAFLVELLRRGHECVVFAHQDTPDLQPEDEYAGIRILRFPFWQALVPGNRPLFRDTLERVRRAHAEFAPDVVHVGSMATGSIFQRLTASASSAPVLVTVQQAHRLKPIGALDSLMGSTLRGSAWTTYCSHSVRDEYAAMVGPDRSRTSVIHNALPDPTLPPAPLPWDPPVVLCLGRLVPDKGFDVALRAFSHALPDLGSARMTVAGEGADRARLETLAGELGISNRLDFVGPISYRDVPARINQATVVLVPSRREAFGLVALEAAQMARPVIATSVGGLPEVVEDGTTGLLVEKDDAAGMGAAIVSLLGAPDAAERLGRGGRQRASHLFEWARYVSSYESLYTRLVADEAVRAPQSAIGLTLNQDRM